MPFDKGNNLGRPPGSKNIDTTFKTAIKSNLSIETILSEIDKMDNSKDKIDAWLKLLSFAYPKPKPTEDNENVSHRHKELVVTIVHDPIAPPLASNEKFIVM
jgi:hypothetical protein